MKGGGGESGDNSVASLPKRLILIIMYFIRTRSTETTTHTIHNYHGTHYYPACPGII